jgi:protein pelota
MRMVSYDARHGTMKLIPDDADDLWMLYNVIRPGDMVRAMTTRQIRMDDVGSRPSEGKRVSMRLALRVNRVSYQSENDRLRIGGYIIEAPEKYALLGSHHTINLDLNQEATLTKNEWPKYDLERIKRSTEEKGPAMTVVALDDEEGAVATLRQHRVQVQGEIRARLPGKLDTDRREGAVNQYYSTLLKVLEEAWTKTRGLIAVVGPGFWKEDFVRYARDKRADVGKSISTVAMVSAGGASGVEEALRSGVLSKVAAKSRVIAETELVDRLMARLGAGDGRASYGLEGVVKSIGFGAVEELLVADTFLRESRDEERRLIEDLMRQAEKMGGRISIISGEHEAGRKLSGLGGIAALLRFRIE